MGKPMPGIDMAIIDNEGQPLPADEEGDIAIRVKPNRAPGLFMDYQGDKERFDACFVGDWYITGDRGYVDADGYFWFVSRADEHHSAGIVPREASREAYRKGLQLDPANAALLQGLAQAP